MLIEQLSDISIKYTLSEKELLEFNVNFDSISRYDSNTRLMISHLMLLAETKTDISIQFGDSEVYVEAFSCNNGNCIIYISLIKQEVHHKGIEKSNFFICNTDNLNHLIRLSKQLLNFSQYDITSSSLYLKDDTFFLLLEFNRKSFEKILYAITEFCEYSTKRPNNQQLIEYYQCLAPDNALSRLSLLRN